MKSVSLVSLLAGSAYASHCSGSNPPVYCCIMGCDSQYANNPSYFGPGTTPACGQPGSTTLSAIFEVAREGGCSPLTENSCSFGPNVWTRGTCSEETVLQGSIPGSAPATATGDPHLTLPHGGRADFRGEHKTLYNFLSAKGLAVNVMTELADFELHEKNHSWHKLVHGSFLTQVHIIARTNTNKIVEASFWADKIGENNAAWANFTVDGGAASSMGPKQTKQLDDVKLQTDYSSLHIITKEFEVIVTPKFFRKEKNIFGLHHRLDLQFKLLVPEADMAVAPHGIIGQGWDRDGKAIDGEQDTFPVSGEFTTYSMAKGAIEGVPNDYKVASRGATNFKFSRFDATSASPRDVAALVAAGELNQPKKTEALSDMVGATEYNFSNF